MFFSGFQGSVLVDLTPLDCALDNAQKDVIEFLTEHGAIGDDSRQA
jgi:hypothetical protein